MMRPLAVAAVGELRRAARAAQRRRSGCPAAVAGGFGRPVEPPAPAGSRLLGAPGAGDQHQRGAPGRLSSFRGCLDHQRPGVARLVPLRRRERDRVPPGLRREASRSGPASAARPPALSPRSGISTCPGSSTSTTTVAGPGCSRRVPCARRVEGQRAVRPASTVGPGRGGGRLLGRGLCRRLDCAARRSALSSRRARYRRRDRRQAEHDREQQQGAAQVHEADAEGGSRQRDGAARPSLVARLTSDRRESR